jgi:predicted nucleotidyltransferase
MNTDFQDNFQGLILYGSMARGEADNFSDIDLLVLLKKPFN